MEHLKGKKRRVTRKECERLREGFMTQRCCGTLTKRECWKTEELCPEKTETCSGNTKPCTKQAFTCSWLREDVEPKEEESKSGKRGTEGERKKGRDEQHKNLYESVG